MRAVTARKLTSGSKAKPPQSNEAAATLTSQQESCLQTDARRRSCSVHLRTMLYGACCVRRHRSDRTCLPAPRYGLRSRFSCQSCSPRPNGHQSDNGQARDAGHHDGIVLGCIHCCLPNCSNCLVTATWERSPVSGPLQFGAPRPILRCASVLSSSP
jgi:hypothetical protein